MPHAKSRLALDLWSHAVDTLLAKGSSFADALDGANMILQAHKRRNGGDQGEDNGPAGPAGPVGPASPPESKQQASSREPDLLLLVAPRRARMG